MAFLEATESCGAKVRRKFHREQAVLAHERVNQGLAGVAPGVQVAGDDDRPPVIVQHGGDSVNLGSKLLQAHGKVHRMDIDR